MASQNISIRDEAYEFLKSLKGQNESFSDVILKLKKTKQNILPYAGSAKHAGVIFDKKVMSDFRKEWDDR